MMLTTGMSIFGKMSVGVRTIASAPRMKIRIANTAIVYGCLSASLTIHISYVSVFPSGATGLHLSNRLTACASESWCPESRSFAQPPGAQQPFRIEQCLSQESSCHRYVGYRHCLDELWNPRGTLPQTNHALLSSSRFRNEGLHLSRQMHRGQPARPPRKRRLPV